MPACSRVPRRPPAALIHRAASRGVISKIPASKPATSGRKPPHFVVIPPGVRVGWSHRSAGSVEVIPARDQKGPRNSRMHPYLEAAAVPTDGVRDPVGNSSAGRPLLRGHTSKPVRSHTDRLSASGRRRFVRRELSSTSGRRG